MLESIAKQMVELCEVETIEKFAWLAVSLGALFLVTKIINKLVKRGFKAAVKKCSDTENKKQLKTVQTIVTSTIAGVIGALALMHVLNVLGVDIRPLLATAGVMGVAIGFGAKRFVEDIITGFSIILSGQAMVGDVVTINSIEGTVEHVNLRMIVLRSANGTVHYIRNGLIDIVSNSTRSFSVAVFETHVGYKENIQRVMDVIKDLGESFKSHDEYGAYVIGDIDILGLDKFSDTSIIIKYTIKTLPAKQFVVQRAFNLMIKERFDSLGIEMPCPHLTVRNVVH